MKNQFYYPSRNQGEHVHVIEWIPEGKIKAALQISHGMAEYIDRYDEFASYLCDRGYYVVGQDHLGHGKSVSHSDNLGFFHETEGNAHIVGDIGELRQIIQKRFSEIPYFMLGHSMGSFLTRQYIQMHGEGVAGVIIMGTGYKSAPLLYVGRLMCRTIALFKGWRYRSPLINNMGLGGYNKSFQPARTNVDWISKDEKIVDAYVKDPLCTFVFTVNGYYHMFGGMLELTRKSEINKIPKELPIFFVSGDKDPVGGFGKDVRKVYDQYVSIGMKDVAVKLYQDDRHEILNETDRGKVYEDLYCWLEEKRVVVK